MDPDFTLTDSPGNPNDILEQLSRATEHRFEPAGIDSAPGATNPDDFQQANPDDFTKEAPPPPEPPVETPPEPKKPYSYYQKEAAVLVNAMDGYAKHFLPNLYRKKLFSETEYSEAKALLEKYMNIQGATKDIMTGKEKILAEKMERLDEMIKAIPTPEESKEVIIQPLAEILQEQEKTVSPYTRLMIAISMVYGPKILPVLG